MANRKNKGSDRARSRVGAPTFQLSNQKERNIRKEKQSVRKRSPRLLSRMFRWLDPLRCIAANKRSPKWKKNTNVSCSMACAAPSLVWFCSCCEGLRGRACSTDIAILAVYLAPVSWPLFFFLFIICCRFSRYLGSTSSWNGRAPKKWRIERNGKASWIWEMKWASRNTSVDVALLATS